MSKKLLLLLVLFVVFFAGFMYLDEKYGPQVKLPLQKAPSPTPNAGANLLFSPDLITANPGVPTQAEIVIQTTQKIPNIVQLEIAYDPLAISNVVVVPGDYFANPTVLLNTIDINTGRISYALQAEKERDTRKQKGTVAILYFTPLLWGNTTSIYFLPKTAIKDSQNNNIFTAGYGLKITKPVYTEPSILPFQPVGSAGASPQF